MNQPRLAWTSPYAQIVPDRRVGAWYRDDFINFPVGSLAVGGTGVAIVGQAVDIKHPGVVQANVAALNDAVTFFPGGQTAVFYLGGGKLTCEWIANLIALSNGAQNITVRCGLGDTGATGDQANAVYFENDFANHANSSNWFGCTANGSVRTKTTTNTAAVALTYQRLKLSVDSLGANVTFSINETVVATSNTNIPTSGIVPFFQVVKQLGATSMSARFDLVEVFQTFASKR